MAASLKFLSFTPNTLSPNYSSSSAAAGSYLFAHSSIRPLSKLVFSLSPINNFAHPTSRFVRNVAFSSELEEEVEDDGFDFSGSRGPSFSPDLKLFVGNLPFTVDSAALAELFGQAGNVEMVEVIYDKLSGRSRGFGFVTMSTTDEVEAAAQQFDGYELQGRALRVNSGPPPAKRENSSFRGPRENSSFRGPRENSSFRGQRENSSFREPRENSPFRGSRGREQTSSDDTNRVHVGNLAWGVDNLTLETLFGERGNVKEAKVVYDRETGRSRGFGFVTFSSPEEVNNAIELFDGIDLNGRSIRVSPAGDRPTRQF